METPIWALLIVTLKYFASIFGRFNLESPELKQQQQKKKQIKTFWSMYDPMCFLIIINY